MQEHLKKRWEKPSIKQQVPEAVNPFAGAAAKEVQTHWEGVAIKDLIAQYGSPLFVLSEKRVRDNVRSMHRAFQTRYSDFIYGWSYKTNYLNAVCTVMHQEGAWAEVVSEFEYEKARALGIPGTRILFNGPNKNRAILELAVSEGAHIHVDHFDELAMLEQIAEEQQRQLSVTLRLNFVTPYTEPWSRFGFNIESGQARDAVQIISESQWLRLNGLHSHIGTFVCDTRAYIAQVNIMCDFKHEAEAISGNEIICLDLGGGFASQNHLQGVYLPPELTVPSLDDYAEAICNALLEATKDYEKKGKRRPTLIIESGRRMVDDAEILVSSVVANKRLSDGRPSLVLDAGLNLLFTSLWYHHKVLPAQTVNGCAEDTVLYGPMCMNIDVVRHSIHLPPMQPGDAVVIHSVGAYNNTQWNQFIEYRPNVVMVHSDGEVSMVRKREDLEVVCAQERMPERWQNSA